MELDGNLSESVTGSMLALSGNGQLILTGSGSFTGGTTVLGGTLDLASGDALAVGSNLTVGDASVFGFDHSLAGVSLGGARGIVCGFARRGGSGGSRAGHPGTVGRRADRGRIWRLAKEKD